MRLAGADGTGCPTTPEKQLAALKQECSQVPEEAISQQPGKLMVDLVFSLPGKPLNLG